MEALKRKLLPDLQAQRFHCRIKWNWNLVDHITLAIKPQISEKKNSPWVSIYPAGSSSFPECSLFVPLSPTKKMSMPDGFPVSNHAAS